MSGDNLIRMDLLFSVFGQYICLHYQWLIWWMTWPCICDEWPPACWNKGGPSESIEVKDQWQLACWSAQNKLHGLWWLQVSQPTVNLMVSAAAWFYWMLDCQLFLQSSTQITKSLLCRYKYDVQMCHSSHQPLCWRERQSLKCWILTPSLHGWSRKKTSSHIIVMKAPNHMLYRMMQPYENVYVWLLVSWLEPRCWMWLSPSHLNMLWII
jgi:hypothetical protein